MYIVILSKGYCNRSPALIGLYSQRSKKEDTCTIFSAEGDGEEQRMAGYHLDPELCSERRFEID